MPSTNFNISQLVYSEELAIGTDSIYSNRRMAVVIIGPIIREGCFVLLCMHLVVGPIQRKIFFKLHNGARGFRIARYVTQWDSL